MLLVDFINVGYGDAILLRETELADVEKQVQARIKKQIERRE